MNKKKHQSDPDESTESNDENDNNASTTECPHVNKAIDLTRVKKSLIRSGFHGECEQCRRMPQVADAATTDSEMNGLLFEFDVSLWLCLRCGHQACGRACNQHALQHYNTPHSDCHCLCVDTRLWSVWCYECDDMVNATCKKRLLEAVDYLRKHAESSKSRQQQAAAAAEAPVLAMVPYVPLDNQHATGTTPKIYNNDNLTTSNLITSVPRPRGLTNLGNTCFFNSVVQCLGQTPYLLNLLDSTSEPGQHFKLPGGKLLVDKKDTIQVDYLEGVLEKWRPLTATLAETLRQLQSGRSEVHVPRSLLQGLTTRMPQFGGGDQHDSHELLRHLLEAVREDDLRRYQSVILDKLGLNKKTDPTTVEGDKKKIIKFYGQQASEMLLPTEQVFRGVLVSTLQCQECQHTSHRDEFFLDLSLPISEKQLPPVLRRKAEDIEENKPSKHQIKKEKRTERKKNKKQQQKSSSNRGTSVASGNVMIGPNLPNCTIDDGNNPDKSDSESDADIEDNAEDTTSTNTTADDVLRRKGVESGYNSDKIDNSSSPDDSNNRDRSPDITHMDYGIMNCRRRHGGSGGGVDDSGVPSPIIGMLSVSPISPDNSPASSETNIDIGGGHNSPTEYLNNEDFNRPESRLSFVNNNTKNSDLKMDLSKLSLWQRDDDCLDGACGGVISTGGGQNVAAENTMIINKNNDDDEKMEQDNDDDDDDEDDNDNNDNDDGDLWTGTISARYQCEDGEYSVQSCLNQFTACELMTGNNKVSCELCTKRHGGAEQKTVYTNATKQLLIYNPPAVLILHLKRFQVYRYRSAKVSKFVKFPLLLDLAPFCSKRSKNLPTFEAGQTKVLYSLYGVVEHSGSMHGGHYVAYVKVRPTLDTNSYRWQFLPKNQRRDVIKCGGDGAMAQGGSERGGVEPDVPSGKWYYVSDSHVSEVPEIKVLSAQAYLLFYERIM